MIKERNCLFNQEQGKDMSEETQFVRHEVEEGIAVVTLDRPPVNVLNIPMLQALEITLEILAADHKVRALILGAGGKLFSAGVDVADHTPEKVGEMIPLFDRVCLALTQFPAPTIAAVQGHALGGGCELVLCCDLAVMAEEAKIGQPEIQLAAFAPIAALRLRQLVGYRAAAEIMYTGENLSAERALAIDLVNAVLPADEVEAWANEKAAKIASLSRTAQRLNKQALYLGYEPWEKGLPKIEESYLNELMQTADALEGLAAFQEKRPPTWKHE